MKINKKKKIINLNKIIKILIIIIMKLKKIMIIL